LAGLEITRVLKEAGQSGEVWFRRNEIIKEIGTETMPADLPGQSLNDDPPLRLLDVPGDGSIEHETTIVGPSDNTVSDLQSTVNPPNVTTVAVTQDETGSPIIIRPGSSRRRGPKPEKRRAVTKRMVDQVRNGEMTYQGLDNMSDVMLSA